MLVIYVFVKNKDTLPILTPGVAADDDAMYALALDGRWALAHRYGWPNSMVLLICVACCLGPGRSSTGIDNTSWVSASGLGLCLWTGSLVLTGGLLAPALGRGTPTEGARHWKMEMDGENDMCIVLCVPNPCV